jgi:hypothetical protein
LGTPAHVGSSLLPACGAAAAGAAVNLVRRRPAGAFTKVRLNMAKSKVGKKSKTKKRLSKPPKSSGKKSNAWRQYVTSNAPIPW